MEGVPSHGRGVGWMIFRVSFNTNHSMTLCHTKAISSHLDMHTMFCIKCVVDENSMQKKFFFDNG